MLRLFYILILVSSLGASASNDTNNSTQLIEFEQKMLNCKLIENNILLSQEELTEQWLSADCESVYVELANNQLFQKALERINSRAKYMSKDIAMSVSSQCDTPENKHSDEVCFKAHQFKKENQSKL